MPEPVFPDISAVKQLYPKNFRDMQEIFIAKKLNFRTDGDGLFIEMPTVIDGNRGADYQVHWFVPTQDFLNSSSVSIESAYAAPLLRSKQYSAILRKLRDFCRNKKNARHEVEISIWHVSKKMTFQDRLALIENQYTNQSHEVGTRTVVTLTGTNFFVTKINQVELKGYNYDDSASWPNFRSRDFLTNLSSVRFMMDNSAISLRSRSKELIANAKKTGKPTKDADIEVTRIRDKISAYNKFEKPFLIFLFAEAARSEFLEQILCHALANQEFEVKLSAYETLVKNYEATWATLDPKVDCNHAPRPLTLNDHLEFLATLIVDEPMKFKGVGRGLISHPDRTIRNLVMEKAQKISDDQKSRESEDLQFSRSLTLHSHS